MADHDLKKYIMYILSGGVGALAFVPNRLFTKPVHEFMGHDLVLLPQNASIEDNDLIFSFLISSQITVSGFLGQILWA